MPPRDRLDNRSVSSNAADTPVGGRTPYDHVLGDEWDTAAMSVVLPGISSVPIPTGPLTPYDPSNSLASSSDSVAQAGNGSHPSQQEPWDAAADRRIPAWEGVPVDKIPTWYLPVLDEEDAKPDKPATSQASKQQVSVPPSADGYVAHLRRLVKSSGIYAVAAMGAPLISLVLAPFLTHHLVPSEYGILAILTTAISLLAGITQLGLGSAFFRAYNYDFSSDSDRRDVLSTSVALLSLITVPAGIVLVISSAALAGVIFGQPARGNLVMLTAGVVFLQNLTVPGFAWMRAENKALFFSLLSLGNLVISLTANLVLVGIFHLGIAGALIAMGSGYASVFLLTIPVIVLRTGIRLRPDVAWSMLGFGVPQVFSFVSFWVLQLSDRYLLGIMASLTQTASYAVAYSMGAVLSTIVIAPFNLAWPTAMYAIAKRDDGPQTFRATFRWFVIVLLFCAYGLSLFSTLLFGWLFPRSYQSAVPVIPIVAASIVCFGVYNIFNIGISVRRKNWFAVLFTTTAAVVNIAVNLVLIPRYGSLGAAYSTLIAYVAMTVMAYAVNQRIYPIPFQVGRFIFLAVLGCVLYEGASLIAGWTGTQWTWLIHLAGLAIYGFVLLLLGMDRRSLSRLKGGLGQGWVPVKERISANQVARYR